MLSDCIKCWSTPCRCGYEYRNYSNKSMVEFISSAISYKNQEDKKIIIDMVAKLIKEEYKLKI